MKQNEIIQSLRDEIAKLQQVIDLLLDGASVAEEVRRPGRPKGSGTRAAGVNPEESAPKKRIMSVEGKARIAAAQKKRWAAQKSLAPARSARSTRGEAAATKRTRKTGAPKSAGKVVPATAKKSSGAGKRSGSTQSYSPVALAKRTATMSKNSAGKKSATKGGSKLVTKSPAKQSTTVALEPQTTV